MIIVDKTITIQATAPVIDIYEAHYHRDAKRLQVGVNTYADAAAQAAGGPLMSLPGIKQLYIFTVDPSELEAKPIFQVAKGLVVAQLKADLNTPNVS